MQKFKDIEVVDNPNVVDDPDVVDITVVIDGLDVRAVDLSEGCHQVNFVRFWEVQVDFL